ncbi:MAG: hypothetical protein WCA08_22340 [Desulfoferrobacter sp.]
MKMNISERHPYSVMGSTCLTREPVEKRITWTIPLGRFGNDMYRVRVLSRDLLKSAAELWRASYPEVSGSPHEFLLNADHYESLVAMEDTWQEDSRSKIYCMPVVEEISTGKIVGATLLTKYEGNLQIELSFVAMHPDYTRENFIGELRRFTRIIALDSGAEYFTSFCDTWYNTTQNFCIEGGWKIAGISPGNFIRRNDDGEEYRGCTVHFYKFINKGDQYSTKPEEWRLVPEVEKIWKAIEEVNRKIEQAYHSKIQKQVMRSYALSP